MEVDQHGHAAEVYPPLGPLTPQTGYRIVIDTQTARQSSVSSPASLSHGTHISLSTGELRPIEDLRVGDRILTRDDGVQTLRWIGQSTLRAVGEFAPIRIRAGTLNNEHDLIVSPDHRLFIYQRSDEMVRAGPNCWSRRGIWSTATARRCRTADSSTTSGCSLTGIRSSMPGIAAGSMLVDSRTRSVLPPEMSEALGEVIPGHSDLPHAGLDLAEALLGRPDAALLRKASTR